MQQSIFLSHQYHHVTPWGLCITPASSISRSEVCTSSKSSGDMHLKHSLNGSLSVMQISCSIALVQPSSFLSSMKMLWKAKMRSQAAAAFQGVQLLEPSKFSFSSNFPAMRSQTWAPIQPHPRVASISEDSSAGGTGEAETTFVTCTPLLQKDWGLGHVPDHQTPCCFPF